MNATYSETTKQGIAELPLLQEATSCLEEVIGPSIFLDQIRVEWDRGQDGKGRTLFTLRLSVEAESVSASFTPRELRDPRELRWSLGELWGDLLQIISRKQLESLTGRKFGSHAVSIPYTDPLLQQPTAIIEEIINSSIFAADVRAEWDRSQDPKGRPIYTLHLSAWGLSVSASFTPHELRDLREVRWRLLDLWDDLLRLSLERSLKNLSEGSDGA